MTADVEVKEESTAREAEALFRLEEFVKAYPQDLVLLSFCWTITSNREKSRMSDDCWRSPLRTHQKITSSGSIEAGII